MTLKRFNWQIWLGFLITFAGLFGFQFFFVLYPATRDFPWVNLLLIAVAVVFLFLGVKRAFKPGRSKKSKVLASILATLSVAAIGLFLFAAFILSKQLPASLGAPKVGQKAPDFSLPDTTGKQVALSELLSAPVGGKQPKGVLLIFYRGYWWPLCNSEFRGIQQNLNQLEAVGIRPVAISVDSPEESRDLREQAGYTFTFLSDPNADVIRRYDLVHAGAGANGGDISRPAEFLVDSSGTVKWVNMTENYWIRARPEDVVEAAKKLE